MDTLNKVVSSFTGDKISFEVKIKKRGFSRLLQKLRLAERKKTFVISPLTLATMARISDLIRGIDIDPLRSGNMLPGIYQIVHGHAKTCAEVVALAITNSKERPTRELIEFLYTNLTAKELSAITEYVVQSLDLSNFTNTIILLHGINILEEKVTP